MKQFIYIVYLMSAFLSLNSFALSSPKSVKNKKTFPVKYVSDVDRSILIKTITIAPVYDNVNGIYSAPIQKLLIELLQADKVWGYSEFPDLNKKIFVETYDTKPKDVIEALQKTKAQGLMAALITKGPHGLNAKLKLYTQDQGMIFVEDSFQDLSTFEISRVREEFVTLYHNLKNKLPYQGYVLSRRGLNVTLNMGEKNGVKIGQEVSLAQILKLNRHPKLKTVIGVEKEIIGKVQITKVEDYLSFAQIIFEKETGVIDVGVKTIPIDYIAYPRPILNPDGLVTGDRYSLKTNQEQKSNDTEKKSDR